MSIKNLTLLSTVVAPVFATGTLSLRKVVNLSEALAHVTTNLCGHPVTSAVLKSICPTLPDAQKAFWDGSGIGLAVRPRGGVRGASQNGDTPVTLDELEAVWVTWTAAVVAA